MMSYGTLLVAVNWYGPYKSIGAARDEIKNAGATKGLYLAIDRRHKRTQAYVGIAKELATRAIAESW
jgi:hypothetical protein